MTDHLRTVWREGGTALGVFIFTRLDPVVVEALAKIGYDYVVVDMQHGLMEFSDMVAMLQALAHGPSTPIVRVPSNDAALIGRALDAGALGVIVPMVNTAAEAARAVAACRYAPVGLRSFGPVRAGITYGRGYAAEANERVICIPMVETAEAVRNVASIVAVPGVDAVYVGPTDLSLTYGQAPALDNDGPFATALQTVATACAQHGVVPGIHANAALAGRRQASGFRMITVAMDMSIVVEGFQAQLRQAREETGITPPEAAATGRRSGY